MNLRAAILFTTLAATASLPLPTQALVNLGEGEIFATASLSGTYDTAIRARSADQEDFVTNLRTGLTYSRPSRTFDFSISAGVSIQRYMDYEEFNDESFFFDLTFAPRTEVQTSRFSFSGGLILDSETRSNEEVGDVITTRTYGANAGLLYDPSSRYNVRLDVAASREDPDSAGSGGIRYRERDRLSAGLTLEVPYRDNSFAELGTSYEKTDSEGDQSVSDSDTYTLFAGLNGQLLEKLSGSFRAGLQSRETERLGSDTTPYLSSSLAWAIDESTSLNLALSRSFGTTLDDRSSETTSASLTARRQLNRRLSGYVGIDYSEDDFTALGPAGTRSDEEYGFFAGLGYELTRNTSLAATVRYTDQDSDDPNFDFDRWQTGVTVSGRW
ncbi:MAG: outer membrane beta-barrel protein [Oceanipulchritudo sp.]